MEQDADFRAFSTARRRSDPALLLSSLVSADTASLPLLLCSSTSDSAYGDLVLCKHLVLCCKDLLSLQADLDLCFAKINDPQICEGSLLCEQLRNTPSCTRCIQHVLASERL